MNVILAHDVREKKSESVSHSVVCDFFDPMDHSWPGSSVRGILQARILEWVTIFFSRGSSPRRDQTQVSRIAGKFFIKRNKFRMLLITASGPRITLLLMPEPNTFHSLILSLIFFCFWTSIYLNNIITWILLKTISFRNILTSCNWR